MCTPSGAGRVKCWRARTFSDPHVVEFVNQRFYAVKFDAESGDPVTFKGKEWKTRISTRPHGRTQRHPPAHHTPSPTANGRIAYPTVVYIDSDLNVLAPVQGYLTPGADGTDPDRFFGEGHLQGHQDYQAFMAGFQGQPG